MSPLDFISLWRATPFRPFVIYAAGGRVIPVVQQMQAAVSPALSLVVVVMDESRVESVRMDEIERCEVLGGGPGESEAGASSQEAEQSRGGGLSPGKLECMSFTRKDGWRVLQAAMSDGAGKPIFSTAGTGFDLHGIETFENGRTLYLHHVCNPTEQIRIIIWPPDAGTFETFAESMTLGELRKELEKRDGKLTSATPRIGPKKPYFRETIPKRPVRAIAPRTRDEDEAPERFTLDFKPTEVTARDHAYCPVITDAWGGDSPFDLSGSSWHAQAKGADGRWAMSLTRLPDPSHTLMVEIDAREGTCRIEKPAATVPLDFLQRHLINSVLYGTWEALLEALKAGPRTPEEPAVVIPLSDLSAGGVVEMWNGRADVDLPFLQPRILGPKGRVLLDLRASWWGAMVRGVGSHVELRLINAKEKKLHAAGVRLHLDVMSQRVTSPDMKGSTSIGELHRLAHAGISTPVLMPSLKEAMARGLELPLP